MHSSEVDSGFSDTLGRIARTLTSDFLPIDKTAVWVYSLCVAFFLASVALDLNGSSSALFLPNQGLGVKENRLLGFPKNIRSDEWSYSTPDVLSQALRSDRFAVETSNFGSHNVALTGNIPVKHFSMLFRPQFWAFFVLPVDYAFSFFWQAKALLLVGGVFTWLLLLTRSSLWALTGTLWYYLSPFTQWCYSWPSALPEMIGSGCLACVCFCYLMVGRRLAFLVIAGAAAVVCTLNFLLCSYLPHVIPLALVNAFVFTGWVIGRRKQIACKESLPLRLGVGILVILCVAGAGAAIYSDLRVAIAGIGDTLYPGRRIVPGGSWSVWELFSHFLAWSTTESHFPPVLVNICEGSGFLWLAPFALLCVSWAKLLHYQRAVLMSLCAIGLILAVWLVFPVPAKIGGLLLLNRVKEGRTLGGLGLANVAIVSLCMTAAENRLRFGKRLSKVPEVLALFAGTVLFFLVLTATNRRLDYFFSSRRVLLASLIAAVLVTVMLGHRLKLFAILLVSLHVFAFGLINPVKRGLHGILDSELYRFMHTNPSYRRDRWIIFTDLTLSPGFFAAVGCEIYNGTRYLPDIDHFEIFRAKGLNLDVLNRLGYLDTLAIEKPPREAVWLKSQVVAEWDVLPDDPILRQIGLRYAAFDKKPSGALVAKLRPLADHAIDHFWLYELPQ